MGGRVSFGGVMKIFLDGRPVPKPQVPGPCDETSFNMTPEGYRTSYPQGNISAELRDIHPQ